MLLVSSLVKNLKKHSQEALVTVILESYVGSMTMGSFFSYIR